MASSQQTSRQGTARDSCPGRQAIHRSACLTMNNFKFSSAELSALHANLGTYAKQDMGSVPVIRYFWPNLQSTYKGPNHLHLARQPFHLAPPRHVCRYMLMFQFKPAAEATFLSDGPVFAPPRDNPPKCAEDIAASLKRLQEPRAATGGINWYR